MNGTCTSCGFASGENNRCPHCGSIARATPRRSSARGSAAALPSFACGVCGGPRVPTGAGGPDAAQPLREAKASLSRSRRARASTVAFALQAAIFTLLTLSLWPAAIVLKLLLLAASVAPLILAVRARGRAAEAQEGAREAEERAWLAAAEEITKQAKQGVTVPELARRLEIEPAQADALLTRLTVHDRTRIDVGDDAEVRYSVTSDDAPRLRVDASDEERFRALEQDAHSERAAGEQAELVAEEHAVLSNPFPTRSRR